MVASCDLVGKCSSFFSTRPGFILCQQRNGDPLTVPVSNHQCLSIASVLLLHDKIGPAICESVWTPETLLTVEACQLTRARKLLLELSATCLALNVVGHVTDRLVCTRVERSRLAPWLIGPGILVPQRFWGGATLQFPGPDSLPAHHRNMIVL
jgi:hypothetical protein